MKKFITNLRIKKFKRRGYDYYTITINGVVDSMVFYKWV